jgi:hypothetical protein
MMPKGDLPEGKQRIIEKDPVSGKIIGSKVIEFKEDEKAEEKVEGFTLTEVESKDEQPEVKKGRPKGIHTPISDEGRENLKKGAETRAKRKFKKENYKDNPLCALINVSTMTALNRTVLMDKPLNKLTLDDMSKISFGESIMYTIEYYLPAGLDADHPLLVLGMAFLGLGIKVVEVRNRKPKQEEFQ